MRVELLKAVFYHHWQRQRAYELSDLRISLRNLWCIISGYGAMHKLFTRDNSGLGASMACPGRRRRLLKGRYWLRDMVLTSLLAFTVFLFLPAGRGGRHQHAAIASES